MPATPAPALGGVLDRSLLSDQAYELLKSKLVSRELAPGSRLVESEIARQFSVSQAPVRDALRRLAHEGMVLQIPRRGSFVAEVSTEEMGDAYATRAALEEIAVRGAMANPDQSYLDRLDQHLAQMRRAAAKDSMNALVNADVQFHQAVWLASGNRYLPRVWLMVEASMRGMTSITNRELFGSLDEVVATHEPLIAGLRSGDPKTPRLFRDHALQTWSRIKKAALGPKAK